MGKQHTKSIGASAPNIINRFVRVTTHTHLIGDDIHNLPYILLPPRQILPCFYTG